MRCYVERCTVSLAQLQLKFYIIKILSLPFHFLEGPVYALPMPSRRRRVHGVVRDRRPSARRAEDRSSFGPMLALRLTFRESVNMHVRV